MPSAQDVLSILHLEDSSDDAVLISLRLKELKCPYSLQWVATPTEFVDALADGDVHIVLSDYRMPGYDGDEALRFVRQNHGHLPFIMLTGELGEERAIETIKRGATDYVLKSNLARLVPSIERAIRDATAEQERRRTEAELRSVKSRLERDVSDMRRLHRLCSHLLRDQNPDLMLQRVLKASLELLGGVKGVIQVYDGARRLLVMKEYLGFDEEFAALFRTVRVGQNCPCGMAAERGERIVSEDLMVDDRFQDLREACRQKDLRGAVSTPLMGYEGRMLGMLTAYYPGPHKFEEHELQLLDLYCQQAAHVMEFMRELAHGGDDLQVLDLYLQPVVQNRLGETEGRGSA